MIFGLLVSVYLLIGLIIGLLTLKSKNLGELLEKIPVPITQTTWLLLCTLFWVVVFRFKGVKFTGKKEITVDVDTKEVSK